MSTCVTYRLRAATVCVWSFVTIFLIASTYKESTRPEMAEDCGQFPLPIDLGVGQLIVVFAALGQWAYYRLEKTYRENFLTKRYLAKQREILMAKVNTLDLVEKVCRP